MRDELLTIYLKPFDAKTLVDVLDYAVSEHPHDLSILRVREKVKDQIPDLNETPPAPREAHECRIGEWAESGPETRSKICVGCGKTMARETL